MSARRLFFALWPESATAALFDRAATSYAPAAGRRPAVVDLHVTLCFLGAVDESLVPELSARAAAIDAMAFELEFDSLAYWRRARLLAATCSSTPTAAKALAESLRTAGRGVGLAPDERPLRPHVTLLRGLSSAAALRQPLDLATPVRLVARHFYLAQSQELPATSGSRSTSARYRCLAGWPLRLPHP